MIGKGLKMTWYEAEEIAKYVFRLESDLDDWAIDNTKMKTALARLDLAKDKLNHARQQRAGDRVFRSLVDEVDLHARHCEEAIRERLMA